MNKCTQIIIGALFAASPFAVAQDAPKYTEAEMEAIIEKQQVEVTKLMDTFMETEEASSALIQQIVDEVASLKDSKDSKTRIIRLKKMMMDDLQVSMKKLQQVRAQAEQELKLMAADVKPGSSQAAQKELAEKLMAERFDAVMTLANSLHKHEDINKFNYYYESNYGNDYRRKRESKEYQRNLKQDQNSEQARKELLANMDRVKINLQNQIGFMEAEEKRLANTPLADQYDEEIARKKEMLVMLDEHLSTILKQPQGMPQQSVGTLNDAMRVEQRVREVLDQLKKNNNLLRGQGDYLKQQIDILNAQRVTLARIQAAGAVDVKDEMVEED